MNYYLVNEEELKMLLNDMICVEIYETLAGSYTVEKFREVMSEQIADWKSSLLMSRDEIRDFQEEDLDNIKDIDSLVKYLLSTRKIERRE